MAQFQALLFSFLLVFSACSPSMFSGKNGDSRLEAQRGSREGKPTCPSLELAGDRLTNAEFRGLLQCFNSNGSIQPLADWIGASSDQSVAPLVEALNQFLFAPGAPREESRSILHQLDSAGELQPFLKHLFSAFEEGDALALALSNLNTSNEAAVREKLRTLAPEQAYRAIHALDRMVNQPSYASLRRAVLDFHPSADVRSRLVRATSRITQAFEKDPSANAIAAKMNPRELVLLFRKILGSDPAEFQSRFSSAELVLRTLGENRAQRLDQVLKLVGSLNTPVSCMNGGRRFDDAWKFITEEFRHKPGKELDEFVTHFAATTALVIRDFCQVPTEFYQVFPHFFDLATSNLGEPAMEWVRHLTEAGIIYDLSRFMSDHRDDIVFLFSELHRGELLAPAVLAISSMNDADAEDFLAVARDLIGGEVVLSETEIEQTATFVSALARVGDPSRMKESLGAMRSIFLRGTRHPWFSGIRSAAISVRWQDAPDLFKSGRAGPGLKFLWELSRDDRLSGLVLDVFRLFRASSSVAFDLRANETWSTRSDFHRQGLGDFDRRTYQMSQTDQDRACRRIRYDQTWESQFSDYFLCLGRPADLGIRFQGLADRGLFRPFIETFSKWPWSADQFRVMLPGFRQFIESGDLGVLIERGGAVFNAASDAVLRPLSRALSRNSEGAKAWLDRLANSTRDAAFFRDLRSLLDGTKYRYPMPSLAAYPKSGRIEQYLRVKECADDDAQIHTRALEIQSAWKTALPNRNETEWRSLFTALASPAGVRAVQGIVRAFSLGDRERATDQKRFTPKDLHQFLMRSSATAQPISIYDDRLETTRVGIFSNLERLETLLRSADFKFFFPENFAEEFMGEFAQAWGDEPRESWPASIRERFGSSQPKRLVDVVDELESKSKQYESLGGLPKIQNCDHLADSFGIPRDPRHWFRAPGVIVPNRIKARLFQIHQMFPLIREELAVASGSRVPGLKIIREIAFQFWDAGSVQVLTQAGQIGLIHGVSRLFSERVFEAQRQSGERGLGHLFKDPALPQAAGEFFAFAARTPLLSNLLRSSISFETVQAGLEGALIITRHLPRGAIQAMTSRLAASTDAELAPLSKWIDRAKPLTSTDLQGVFNEVLALSDPDEKARGQAFDRVMTGLWKTGVETGFVVEWVFAMASEIESFGALPPVDSSDRQKIVRMLREFTGYLAENDGSIRAASARNAREQWISDSLRGASVARLTDWIRQDPQDAAATLRRLLMSFRSNEFQKFLMTAARQLPR